MASERRRQILALIDQLFAGPRQFDFFQAVRLLEHEARRPGQGEGRAGRRPLGYDNAPKQEAVRFRVNQSLGFPVSEIENLEVCGPGDADTAAVVQAQPQMSVNFMGLTGPNGVLPRHYTHLVLEQLREDAHALPDFLDLFNHRLISLFYRAWEKYRAAILVERTRGASSQFAETPSPLVRAGTPPPEPDLFTFGLFCLVGLGTGGQRGRMAVSEDAFLYYAGNFSRRPANSLSLQLMLAEFLRTEVALRQFYGQWLALLPEEQSRLPAPGGILTVACQLGKGAVAGERVWDVQSKFRVRVGPIGYDLFCRLLPSGDTLLPLGQFLRTYVGPEWDFDVQLVLHGPEAPWCALDGNARLGWNTWVRANPFHRDVDDVVIRAIGEIP